MLARLLHAVLSDPNDEYPCPEVAETGLAIAAAGLAVVFIVPSESMPIRAIPDAVPLVVWSGVFLALGVGRFIAVLQRRQRMREICCALGCPLWGMAGMAFLRSAPISAVLLVSLAITEILLSMRLRGAR